MSRIVVLLSILALIIVHSPVSAQPLGLPGDLSGDAEAAGFADLLFAHGMLKLGNNNYAEALEYFEKAARTMPGDGTYRYFEGHCQLQLGRQGEAINLLESVLPPVETRVDESRIRYDLGDAYYRDGQTEAARNEFERVTKLDDQDANARFYLGLAQVRVGATEDGLANLERAVQMDPVLAEQGAYYLGVAAFKRGDVDEARRQLEQAVQGAVESGTQSSGRQWLRALDQEHGLARGDIRVHVAIESDSNPGQINDDIQVDDVGTDQRAVLGLRGVFRPLVNTEQERTVALVLNGYANRHFQYREADVAGVQGVVQAAWGSDPLGYWNGPLGYAAVPTAHAGSRRTGFLLQFAGSFFNLDRASFRRDYEGAASFVVQQTDFGKIQVDLGYDDVTYFDEFNEAYSGSAVGVKLAQTFHLGRPQRNLRIGIDRTIHETQLVALDHVATQALAELALPLGDRTVLFLWGSYTEDNYDDASELFYGLDSNRKDKRYDAIARLNWSIARHHFLTVRFGFLDRESNVETLSYDRRVFGLGYTWRR